MSAWSIAGWCVKYSSFKCTKVFSDLLAVVECIIAPCVLLRPGLRCLSVSLVCISGWLTGAGRVLVGRLLAWLFCSLVFASSVTVPPLVVVSGVCVCV